MARTKQTTPHPMLWWLGIAAGLTVMSMTTYVVVQQVYRQTANDPQVQIATDVMAKVAQGADAASVVGTSTVDMATTENTFIIVTDGTGNALASSALLHQQLRVPPTGVLRYAGQHGQNRVTWQPESGLRLATIVLPITPGNGYVIVGRSLRETEQRIRQLGLLVVAGWLASLLASLVVFVLASRFRR